MISEPARLRFGLCLMSMSRRWRRAIEQTLSSAELTDATWAPLVQLANGGDNISQTELANRVGLDTSSLVRLVDLLEGRGFIRRLVDPSDRRARRIILTDAGHAEYKRIRQEISEIETRLLEGLDNERLSALMADFQHIETRIDAILKQEHRP